MHKNVALLTAALPLALVLGSCRSAPPIEGTGAESEIARLRAEVRELRTHVASMTPEAQEIHGSIALAARVEELLVRQAALQQKSRRSAPPSRTIPAASAIQADASSPGLDAAASALVASLRAIESAREIHVENIANASVTGFKRRDTGRRAVGVPLESLRTPEAAGARLALHQGALELTGNMLDFGIEGPGFFEFVLPSGDLRYTRDGTFRQDAQGRLVTEAGHPLTDPIAIPPDAQGISVGADGGVYSLGEDGHPTQIGTLRVHTFPNASALASRPDNTFTQTPGSGPATARRPGTEGAGALRQGYIERSNVTLSRELLALRRLSREALTVRHALAEYGYVAP